MIANNCRLFPAFLRIRESNHTFSLLKFYRNMSQNTAKKFKINCNYNKQKKVLKTVNLIATVGIAACAGSFVSNMKTDPLFLEENYADEFDELFKNETFKEDIDQLINFGPIPYLLVGCGPAAMAAYRAIRIKDPTAKILMICEEPYNPYKTAPLSSQLWYLKSHDPDVKKNRIFYNDYYLSVQQMLKSKNGGLALIRGKKVLKIDPISQHVVLDTGEHITYEKCMLVPTPKSKSLPVFQDVEKDIKKHITLFHSLKDFLKLEKLSREVKSIAVIGGGILGSELASGLNEYSKSVGLNVIQIIPEPRHLSNILPEYLSKWLEKKFQNRGIHVKSNVTVKSVCKCNEKIKLHLSNDEIISVDHVVVAVGNEPNTDIALSSGLETDNKLGGYLVNAEMKSRKNLWIAGDSASFYDVNLGRCRVVYPENVIHNGNRAGENMVGNEKPFDYESNWWSVLSSDIFCEGVGNTDATLSTIGVFVKHISNDEESNGENSLAKMSETQIEVNQIMTNKSYNIPYQMSSNQLDYFKKGVIFYLKDDIIVGVLLWNIAADADIPKKVIKNHYTSEKVVEIARLFQSAVSINDTNEVKSKSS